MRPSGPQATPSGWSSPVAIVTSFSSMASYLLVVGGDELGEGSHVRAAPAGVQEEHRRARPPRGEEDGHIVVTAAVGNVSEGDDAIGHANRVDALRRDDLARRVLGEPIDERG